MGFFFSLSSSSPLSDDEAWAEKGGWEGGGVSFEAEQKNERWFSSPKSMRRDGED